MLRAARAWSRFQRRLVLGGLALVIVLALGVGIGLKLRVPKLTETETQAVVVSTLVREAPQSFLVTGDAVLDGTSTISSATVLLPGVLDLRVSEDRAEVKAPGRISYGFDVRLLTADDIAVAEDGTVVVQLPDLVLHEVAVQMDRLELHTERGWLPARDERSDELTRKAFENLQTVVRREGNVYLRDSERPYEHSARALALMLRPALEAAGIQDPRIRVVIGDRFSWQEPEG